MKQLFAVIRTRGGAWQDSYTLESQRDWTAHAAFMDALEKDGFVVLGGPLPCGRGSEHPVQLDNTLVLPRSQGRDDHLLFRDAVKHGRPHLQVLIHQCVGRVRHPLGQRDVLVLTALEHL